MEYDVLKYGAFADGKTLDTKAVQAAINACSLVGGRVIFPKGDYVLSSVFLRSNVEIFFEDGVQILGSLNFDDYCPDEELDYPLYQDKSHSCFHRSMFIGVDLENIKITGKGKIDMRSVWDEENVRNMAHRGAKGIALKNCKKVELSGFELNFATDLAVYFAGCEDVEIYGLKMRTYIDGISPDNCKNVNIHDCEVEAGDDAIVFKSSYTLNRLDVCSNIKVWNCKLKSRCYAIKFGTETNGGFNDIQVENIQIYDTRICGIGIESADGAIIDGLTFKNIKMKNVNVPLFVFLGKRMRGPSGREIGRIRNILFEDITATGEYVPYEIVPCFYDTFKANDWYQDPKKFGIAAGLFAEEYTDVWQMTSNMCGLRGIPLENITIRNAYFELDGGVQSYDEDVPEECQDYPEVYNYGRILPAKGIYFRYVDGLTLDNVRVKVDRADVREDFVFEKCENVKVY